MFMLGDFSSGLFGGANNVFSLATKYQELRTKFRDWGNANEVESAMQAGANDSGTGGLYGAAGTSTAPADTSRPTYDTFDDDPELSKLPKLAKKAAIALKEFGTSPREGTAYGSTPAQSSAPTAPTTQKRGALGNLIDQPGPGETGGAQGQQNGSGL